MKRDEAEGVARVRTHYASGRPGRGGEYECAVAAIAANCGNDVRTLLSGHLLLPPHVVRSLARTSPERQAFELGEVRASRRPFATKTDVFDTTGYGEVGSRLARAGGGVTKFARAVDLLVATGAGRDERAELDRVAADLLRDCGSLWAEVRRAYATRPKGLTDASTGFSWRPPRDWTGLAPLSARSTLGVLGAPAAFVRKCLRDLKRVPALPPERRFWPTRGEAHSLGLKLFQMTRLLLGTRERLAGRHAATTVTIVTHARPDADALAAAWLAARYLFAGRRVELAFVTSGHNWAAGPKADCVVDVGGLCDPALGLFDHRPPARAERHETCATELVWRHLTDTDHDVRSVEPLVQAVGAGDNPKGRANSTAYTSSRSGGFHAVVAAMRARGTSDRETWTVARDWLDRRHRLSHPAC